jgi:TolB-like protein
MMLKKLFFLLLMMIWTMAIFGQAKPRLGILPFAGGAGGDGETVATLFSLQSDIQGAFTVVPRTSAVNALVAEQDFQMSGYTDSDTIARIGHMLNADFVVSGHIRRLGDRNLVITTIVGVETFEQMAGDYREYRAIEEIPSLLPHITRKMIDAARRDTSKLPKLAVAPFHIANEGVNERDAEVLAQILSIEIVNTGRYAVLPRTSTMQAAMRELNFQMSGYTSEEGAKALGRAINAEYVLSTEARSLGSINMFIAQILHVEDGSLLAGDSRNYRIVEDGMRLMPELALLLADKAGATARIGARNRERARAAMLEDSTKLWSVGASAGTSFAAPWVIGTARGTLAPWRHTFFDIGLDAGFITQIEGAGYWSLYPFVHFNYYRPLGKSGWYAGGGVGFMIGEYTFDDLKVPRNTFAVDVTTGFLFFDFLDISYTLRTNFTSANNKAAVGYVYRFK